AAIPTVVTLLTRFMRASPTPRGASSVPGEASRAPGVWGKAAELCVRSLGSGILNDANCFDRRWKSRNSPPSCHRTQRQSIDKLRVRRRIVLPRNELPDTDQRMRVPKLAGCSPYFRFGLTKLRLVLRQPAKPSARRT